MTFVEWMRHLRANVENLEDLAHDFETQEQMPEALEKGDAHRAMKRHEKVWELLNRYHVASKRISDAQKRILLEQEAQIDSMRRKFS